MNIQILSAKLTTRTSGTAVFIHGNSRLVIPFLKRKTVVFAEKALVGGKDVTATINSPTFRSIERSIEQSIQDQDPVTDRTEVQYSRLNEFLQRPVVLSVIAMSTLALVGVFGGMA